MEVLPKDVYLYLMNFGDDRTILNMLSVNKKFNDDKFFIAVLERRYPLITRFKKENETWRSFYVKMIYYIALLNDEYDFPYFPTTLHLSNPEILYKQIKSSKSKELANNYKLMLATSSGNVEIVNKYLDNKIGNGNKALGFAKDINIVKLLIEKGKVIYSYDAMRNAAYENHIDIIKYLISKGARSNNALPGAAYTGNIELVKYLLTQGANSIQDALYEAARGRQFEMMKFLGPYATNEQINYVIRNAITIKYSQDVIDTLHSLLH
jgi:hypothetical protein